MKVLIVEDDLFKFSKIEDVVKYTITTKIERKDNVHDTVIYLQYNSPDIIILDMSLPSHAVNPGEGSPLSMLAGGIEIILELEDLDKIFIPIIILTQYPEIEIDGEYYSIRESKDVLTNIYNISELAVCLYEHDSSDWKDQLSKFIEKNRV